MNDINKIWNKNYDNVNNILKSKNIEFLNHGYYPPHPLIEKESVDFKNQHSLYLSLLDNLNVKNKTILEIGCGRGGGIKTLNKYFNFKKVDACDINKKNIDFCKIDKTNINFKVSNAEELEYEDNSFDVIINVESSHCYKDPLNFFNEIKRVLKKDGIFIYADVGMTIMCFPIAFNLFKNINRTDITDNVRDSCKDDIINFEKLNIEKNEKEWFIDIAKNKYHEYSLSNNQYIKYVCSDSDKWFNKEKV